MKTYDIAVIGAGPAGATFARLAAESGRKILVIDGSDKYGKPCGGLLAPDAQKVLAGFDLTLPRDILADPQIFAVRTIDLPKKIVKYYSRMYLNMDRKRFDEWLVSLIPDNADTVKAHCRSIAKNGRGYTVTYKNDSGEYSARCRYLVGADGANSIVRRTFFDTDIMYYVAIQQWFECSGQVDPFYSCIFDPETSESCSWSIHKDKYFIFGGSFAPEKCREMFERQKQRLSCMDGFCFGEPIRTEACKVYRPRKMSDFCTGEGNVFLIGEAAGFISPSSFEGISSAMKSGTMLAEAFLGGGNIYENYNRKALALKLKMYAKCYKRPFMYEPVLRELVMRSGVTAIDVKA
ncbi:MAG: FAD-binding protein [Oscillospiraceae bacterium]|nr:FAD-binding protein [Oscillospiraceae bacterium]